MKKITVKDIDKWEPCYNPREHLPENWSGTALDVLKMDNVSATDRLFVVLRESLIDSETIHKFAAWCGLSVNHLMTHPDSGYAVYTHSNYAHGKCSRADWVAANALAVQAVKTANCGKAAVAAHQAAVWDTEWVDERNLYRNEVWGTEGAAAWIRARHASRALGRAAEDFDAARAKAEQDQITYLISLLEGK